MYTLILAPSYNYETIEIMEDKHTLSKLIDKVLKTNSETQRSVTYRGRMTISEGIIYDPDQELVIGEKIESLVFNSVEYRGVIILERDNIGYAHITCDLVREVDN